jgi:hypothetical protein
MPLEAVMNIDNLLPYLVGGFTLFMIVSFSIVAWQKSRQDIERIRSYLLDRGYQEIVIHYQWFDFDKSNSTYRIECRHPTSGHIRTSCKIHRGSGWDGDIYWKDPL